MSILSAPFPGRTVISSFESTEQALCDVLDVVPYVPEHEDVWSPRIATIVLEACSQLDSLWKHQIDASPCAAPKKIHTITDHFTSFGPKVSPRWLLFWGDTPREFQPFHPWSNTTTYSPLDWWGAYNNLKHNRLKYREEAKLKWAVQALGGLLLAITSSETCRPHVGAAGWCHSSGMNPVASLSEDSPQPPCPMVIVETKLFAYPVGLWKAIPLPRPLSHDEAFQMYFGATSHRVRSWIETNMRAC